uniref:RUN and FYVE domain-containing protein 2 n=1 Tax=Anopheles dirus TaxID=7168 RepID=A0A182NKW3_9DIPT
MRALGIAQPNNHHQTTAASTTTSSSSATVGNVGSVGVSAGGGSAAGINGKNGNGEGHHHGAGATLITLPRAVPATGTGSTGDGHRPTTQLRGVGGGAVAGGGSVSDTAAQDTIYLCNFRVTVDGEWLCLKELQDLDIKDGQTGGGGGPGGGADALGGGGGGAGGGTGDCNALNSFGIIENVKCDEKIIERDWVNYYSRDPASIERSNLVKICKLVVKELLEQSLRFGRMLDSDHLPLQHFFIVLEHVLRHGLKPKKGLLGPKKELWDILQSVERYCVEALDITSSVRDLPTVRTHMGRARAWLRLALMQKKLADYLQVLIEHRDDSLAEYYEPHALMMSDEIIIIVGILVGLNVIDCNLCVKEEDLDSQQGVIDFSLYLRSSSRNSPDEENNGGVAGGIDDSATGAMTAVLDQKNYIEELNRHLNATVANLQAKVESLTTTNALMKEDLAIARNSLMALQAENAALRRASQHGHPIEDKTNVLDRFDPEMAETLAEERKKRQEIEKELDLQVSLKAETEMAMKLLEKDIHEKQDTIVSLRRQLEDIKSINLDMYRKLQECELELTQKGEMVSRLQIKASQIGKILSNLERKGAADAMTDSQISTLNSFSGGGVSSPSGSGSYGSGLVGPPNKKPHLKIGTIPPFNANKLRKSPSVGASATAAGAPTTAAASVTSTDNPSVVAVQATQEAAKGQQEQQAQKRLSSPPQVDVRGASATGDSNPPECEASLKHKTELMSRMETQRESMASAISQLEKKYSSETASLHALQESSQALSLQVVASEQRAARSEADLRIEREWRTAMQEKEMEHKELISDLQLQVKQLSDDSKQLGKANVELEKLRSQWAEDQRTLEELGVQLSVNKLQISELKEKVTSTGQHNHYGPDGGSRDGDSAAGAAGGWTPDKIVSKCTGCDKEFSMTRRKHHCRNCGKIFCSSCSEHVATLTPDQQQTGNGSKPVRVCDYCWEKLASK